MNQRIKSDKKNKGITLIALVITIILLLLLAGISIATLTGENGVLTKGSTAKKETKKAQYQEALELIGVELRADQGIDPVRSKDYMNRYEERIQKEIEKEELWKGAIQTRKDDNTILVLTEEGWVYQVTEKEVIYLGDRTQYPKPPNLQEAEIKFNYEPSGWTNEKVTVKISTKAENFSLQYALIEPDKESSWKSYPTEGIAMTENGEIYARLINEFKETSQWATGNVSKIERTKPNLTITVGDRTTSSIRVNVSANDTPSGLAKSGTYQYYLNGTQIPAATGNSYNFTGLKASTQYNIKVVVYDEAGNWQEQTITPMTANPPTVADYKGGAAFGNTTIIKDPSGKPVKVPGGFKIASDSANYVDDGVVIEDGRGNQFVWIPVTDGNKYVRNTTYYEVNVSKSAYNDTGYLPNGVTNEKQTVINAGGFYIARFEAGKEGTNTLVSKKNATVWYNVSQPDAKVKAKTIVNTNYAKSALISGIQWDLVMAFINGKRDGNGAYYYVNTVSNSRHKGSPASCGKNLADKVCNIYDLEGNYWELIAEKQTVYSTCVYRGGQHSKFVYSAAHRNTAFEKDTVVTPTFRVALYVL